MAHTVGGGRTRCPYYLREDRLCIDCEGFAGGSTVTQTFVDEAAKERWQARRCFTMQYGRRCPVAKVLEAKYERQYREEATREKR